MRPNETLAARTLLRKAKILLGTKDFVQARVCLLYISKTYWNTALAMESADLLKSRWMEPAVC